ncbi:MAG: site-specific integrase [Geobacter sp.]|nr:site-specific integrase [Geobacter sp.]
MKVTTFTDTMIRKLKPADKKYVRGEGNGFTLRVMPSGVKTWLYVYAFNGKRREMNLGSYPDVALETARDRFNYAKARVKNGFDPMEEKEQEADARRKAPTVADLVSDYIEQHAKRKKRSWAKDEAILNRDVVSLWGKRKAADIVKRDVSLLLRGIIDRGAPAMANNCFQIVRKMFNWAVQEDILPHTPCAGIPLPSAKQSRKRTLTEAEIKTSWDSLDQCAMSDEIRRALKLVLVTAQRPGEVIGMHSSEIDDRWWTIPVARQKVSKVKEGDRKPHRVYLADTAIELIGELEVADTETGETKPKGYIFKTPHKAKDRPMGETALAVAVGRGLASSVLDEKGNSLIGADGKSVTINKIGIDHFTPHDLRRTAATFMGGMGFMDEVIDAVLNHVKKGVISTYNRHDYDKEKKQALEAWGRKLQGIVSGQQAGNVISINRGGRG